MCTNVCNLVGAQENIPSEAVTAKARPNRRGGRKGRLSGVEEQQPLEKKENAENEAAAEPWPTGRPRKERHAPMAVEEMAENGEGNRKVRQPRPRKERSRRDKRSNAEVG